jgi:hypothetical protein
MLRAHTIKDSVLVGFIRRLADVVVEPKVKKVHWADFGAVDQCIAAGDLAATEAAARIRELLRHESWRSILRPPLGKRLAQIYLASADLRFSVE